MGERDIDISLDEELYEKARAIASAEGVSVETWLSRVAERATDLASKQAAMREFVATYGEASPEDQQTAHDKLTAAGFFDPPSYERTAARLAALARLRHGVMPDQDVTLEEERVLERKAG